MKIPLIPVHIISSKKLEEKIKAEKALTRDISNGQVKKLLADNFIMANKLRMEGVV